VQRPAPTEQERVALESPGSQSLEQALRAVLDDNDVGWDICRHRL
jgi:hypothetical protein